MLRMLLALAALAACCCTLGRPAAATVATSPSPSGYPALEASFVSDVVVPAVRAAIYASTQPGGPTRPLLAQIVRLIFHDCAGGAGCNGCLSLSLPPNRGLETAAAALEQLYDQLGLASKMSRADFWALSGVIAAQYALPHTAAASYGYGLDPLAFRWGRADCATAPEDPAERISDFPLSTMGFGGVMAFYATRFGFTTAESVAISGAHNLGRAQLANSGFQGTWVLHNDQVGSAYFANMIDPAKRWHQIANPPFANGRFNYQWVPSSPQASTDTPQESPTDPAAPSLLLLNSDLALYKDLGTPNITAGGLVTCTYDTCPNSPTWAIVQQYAVDEHLFLGDFARAYDKMMNVCGRRNDSSPIPCTALQPLVGGGAGEEPCDDKGKGGKGKDKDTDEDKDKGGKGKGEDKDKDKGKGGKGKDEGCKGKGKGGKGKDEGCKGKGKGGVGIGVGVGIGNGFGIGIGVGKGY